MVGLTALKSAPSVQSRYFRTLGFDRAQTIEETVTHKLIDAVRKKRGDRLPVRLAGALDEFLIDSEPRWDETVPHGRLEFDDSSKRFVVLLGGQRGAPRYFAPHLGRLRFTYAHEVAHRFFFVQSEGRWQRALELVAKELPDTEALRARRVLTSIEESLCNTIAAKVLIPNDKLVEVCAQYAGFNEDIQVNFFTALTAAARRFAVTRKCFFVRLRKGIEQNEVSLTDNFCALLCGMSREEGSSRSVPKMRAIVSLFPIRMGDYELTRKFNGIAVEKFGPELLLFCSDNLQKNAPSKGELRLPLRFQGIDKGTDCKQKIDIKVRMDGSWARVNPGEILLWGHLNCRK